MDPLFSLKRPEEVHLNLCMICQERHRPNDAVRASTEYSRNAVREAMNARSKLRDVDNREAISQLEQNIGNALIVWHANCYATFTSKEKIKRLQDKLNRGEEQRGDNQPSPRKTRSRVEQSDWDKCLFCQNENSSQLRNVMTFNTNKQILEFAEYNFELRLRIGGISDLIAAEAKYHLACYSAAKRESEKVKNKAKDNDLALIWLCEELEYASEKGHVIKLSDAWERYTILAERACITIPAGFVTRRATFKENLVRILGDRLECIQSFERGPTDRHTLLVPKNFVNMALSQLLSEKSAEDSQVTMPTYHPENDSMLSLVHVALRFRGDLKEKPGHKGLDVDEEDAYGCIPESLYMFLEILFGGERLFEGDIQDTYTLEEKDSERHRKVLSLAQDIVYGVSCGKKWTPKHVGLGSTMHQVTRSKDLVKLFHRAGHILSYDQILQVDTILAESALKSLDQETGAVIPPNLQQGKFVHFSADNIDILDETIDGKNTFHATQIAAWQRGQESVSLLSSLKPSKRRTLEVPESMDRIEQTEVKTSEPVFLKAIETRWFESTKSEKEELSAQAKDMAFHILRHNGVTTSSWTGFNQKLSKGEKTEVTQVGYMPILQAPAHELDTLNAVVKRCMHVADALGQRYTVITVDQALYCKLVELKWAVKEYRDKLIVQLGGLHISMCFLATIGNHMASTGLLEAWVESGLLGPNSAEKVLNGKEYKRAMRAHKITAQALWRKLVPFLLRKCEKFPELANKIKESLSATDPVQELIASVMSNEFKTMLKEFEAEKSQENVNFKLWWSYLEMVTILLNFTRAQREGNWALYLGSFRAMMPYFFRYDHLNYAKWGSVFLADMNQLPTEVRSEFEKGNFVVKWREGTFNQVSPDHSLEWINGIGKRGGGIVGITKTSSALSR